MTSIPTCVLIKTSILETMLVSMFNQRPAHSKLCRWWLHIYVSKHE